MYISAATDEFISLCATGGWQFKSVFCKRKKKQKGLFDFSCDYHVLAVSVWNIKKIRQMEVEVDKFQ